LEKGKIFSFGFLNLKNFSIFESILSASGQIFKVHHHITKAQFAIKKMSLFPETRETMKGEILIMKTCKHPNIVRYQDSFIVDFIELWVIMEYLENGSLTDILNQHDFGLHLDEPHIAFVLLEILTAIYYIHKLEISKVTISSSATQILKLPILDIPLVWIIPAKNAIPL